jgi:hypothetical protein
MPEPQSPYNQADLIQLIGQAAVELAFMRAQIVRLQERVAELEAAPANGVVHPVAEVITPA